VLAAEGGYGSNGKFLAPIEAPVAGSMKSNLHNRDLPQPAPTKYNPSYDSILKG